MLFTRLAAAAALACSCLPAAQAHSPRVAKYGVVDLGAVAYGMGINAAGLVAGQQGSRPALFGKGGRVTDLGTLGGDRGDAIGLNNVGQVVGEAAVPIGETHAFVWRDGVMTDLGTLDNNVAYSAATAINDAGQIAGWSYADDDADVHAFLYENGTMKDIGKLPGMAMARARGINAAGHVVGVSVDDSGCAGGAFLYRNGKMSDIGALGPGWTYTAANAINDLDQIVGAAALTATCGSDPGTTAFIHENGALRTLGFARAGDDVSVAASINNHGVIVGWSTQGWNTGVAFVSDGGTPVDLNTLLDASGAGWVLNQAWGVDDKGAITGMGTINGVRHAFRATPRYLARR